jgi:hypothetical protein
VVKGDNVTDYRRQFDAHIGSPDTVLHSLNADSILRRATDISFQVHSVEPTHRDTLRSIELIAERIAPTSFEETPMSLSQDILAELAEIKPGSPLAEARATRDAATRHAQGSYEILFSQQDADFALDERFAVAAKVARWHSAEALAAHYAGLAWPIPPQNA